MESYYATAIYIYTISSRTYNLITVQLKLALEIYHLLFVSGSTLVNRVTEFLTKFNDRCQFVVSNSSVQKSNNFFA